MFSFSLTNRSKSHIILSQVFQNVQFLSFYPKKWVMYLAATTSTWTFIPMVLTQVFFFTKGWGSWSPHNHNKSIHLQTCVATIEVLAAYTLQTCNYTIQIHVQYYTHTLYAVLKMWKKGGRIHVFSGLEQYLFCHAFSWFYIYLERKQLPPPPPKINTCTDKYMYIIDSSTSCKLMKTDTQHTSEEFTPEQPCTCVHIKKY